MNYYKLDENHNVILCTMEEAEWGDSRRVAIHEGTYFGQEVEVSTVFLVIDHGFGREGQPIVFETMVFGGPLDQECERYTTWDEAIAGHSRWIERVGVGE